MTPEVNTDINAFLNTIFGLSVDMIKAHKANKGVAGYVDAVAQDVAVQASLKVMISNFTKIPSDFKSLTTIDYLGMIQTVFTGIQTIVNTAKA